VYVPGVPAEVAFANSTTGYYVDASPIIDGSPLFSFDPSHFQPVQVGGSNVSLPDPDSLSLGGGGVWLAEHGDSGLAHYSLQTSSWSVYPTSPVAYIATTLPYFVEANGSLVWFNEHFANRMAVLDATNMTLTEYSLSDPPAGNLSQIANALTSAVGGGRAWFAESTASAVGFVDASYRPTFSISANETSVSVPRGGTADLQVEISGRSSSPLSVNVSGWDSPASTNASITARPSAGELQSLAGSQSVQVAIEVSPSTPPGGYTALVTVSDGLVSRSVYVELSVLP
jgi:virginiamycin B lyase